MAEERTYKITCNECGYSEVVPASRLPYEEGKTCPKCYKGKMYWVPTAEEARRREVRRRAMPEVERKISIAWAILAGLLLAVGGGVALAVAVSRAAAPGMCLELHRDKFYYFIYTGPSKTFIEALGECGDPNIIWTIDVYDPETNDYWPPADPEHDILETGTKCRVMVQETCTLCGFELIT